MAEEYTYIDLGAHNGNSIRQFFRDFPGITRVYAWEPVNYADEWAAIEREHPSVRFEFIRAAASTRDGQTTFTLADYGSESHTIHPDCYHYTRGKQTQVECKDFSAWLRGVADGSKLIVKIDIEGAEYDILDSLIEDDSVRLIDRLYCEFHDWIMPDSFAERHEDITRLCPVEIHGWG
jgi:FkbM family methyltransferase